MTQRSDAVDGSSVFGRRGEHGRLRMEDGTSRGQSLTTPGTKSSGAAPVESTPLFYEHVVDVAELRKALAVEGFDEEIAIVRIKLREHVDARPEDLPLMLKCMSLIVRAVAARYRMSDKRAADLSSALGAAMGFLTDQLVLPEQDE